jgi:hypothetical protein
MSLALLAIITSACSFHPHRLGDFTQVVDVAIDEDILTQSKLTFKIHNHDFWKELDVDVDRLELHDGYIHFLGTKVMPDGTVADCSIDVRLGAEDGMLTAQIIAVDIPGVTLNDSSVIEINHDMEAHLYLHNFDPNSDVQFQEVEVTEDALRIKVQVTIRF